MSTHTDKYPEFDGSTDWKAWTGKIRPKLFKKKSRAYPDKTLFHLTKPQYTVAAQADVPCVMEGNRPPDRYDY